MARKPATEAEWQEQVNDILDWAIQEHSFSVDNPPSREKPYPVDLFDHVETAITVEPLFETEMRGGETVYNELKLYKTVNNPNSLKVFLQDEINAHANNASPKARKSRYKLRSAESLLGRVDRHIERSNAEHELSERIMELFDEQDETIPAAYAALEQGTKKGKMKPSALFLKTARLIDRKFANTEQVDTSFSFEEETERVLSSVMELDKNDVKFLEVMAGFISSNTTNARAAWVEARRNVEDVIFIEQDRLDRQYHSDNTVNVSLK